MKNNQMYLMTEPLIQWFHLYKRRMPWREDPTPYHIWVSEIMLQQTRVDTVMPYYARFIKVLPNISALAECPEEELLKLWEGLGYYSRVKNMKKAAEMIVEQYDGVFPVNYEEIKSLPGIGSYTAGAISSIAYLKPESVVDGNVLRVISRLTGSFDDITLDKTKKEMEKHLRNLLIETGVNPSDFNQSLMELGALVCLPNGAPECMRCPLKDQCTAFMKGLISEIPVKTPKKKREIRDYTVLIIKSGGRTALEKRPEKGLLSGLYGYPMLDEKLDETELLARIDDLGIQVQAVKALPEKKHIFTHVEWHMKAYLIIAEKTERLPYIFVTEDELNSQYALPTAFKKW